MIFISYNLVCYSDKQQQENMVITTPFIRILILEIILLGTHVQKSCTYKSGAVDFHVTPNRLQHFEYESLLFDCGDYTELRGMKITEERLEPFSPPCNIKKSSSSCTISRTYPTDSAEYWCETKGGQKSNSVNITITAGSVILESPVFPVFEGDTVTLRCISKTTSTIQTAKFYKNNDLLEGSASDNMQINNVSSSDEGQYKCNIPGVGTSPESWLHVRSTADSSAAETHGSIPTPVLYLLCIVAPILVILLLLLVVRFQNTCKNCGGATRADESSLQIIYTAVTTKETRQTQQDDGATPADESSPQVIYINVTTNETRQTQQDESGSSSFTPTLNPPAAEDLSSPEEVVYSPVQTVQCSDA